MRRNKVTLSPAVVVVFGGAGYPFKLFGYFWQPKSQPVVSTWLNNTTVRYSCQRRRRRRRFETWLTPNNLSHRGIWAIDPLRHRRRRSETVRFGWFGNTLGAVFWVCWFSYVKLHVMLCKQAFKIHGNSYVSGCYMKVILIACKMHAANFPWS